MPTLSPTKNPFRRLKGDVKNVYFDDNKVEEGHSRRALRGGAGFMFARAVNGFVQIGSVLFLARLLSPEDYGLVGMVMAITGFAHVFVDLGTRDAVAQRTRINHGEVSTLFWITNAVGCSFALLVALSGPFIARFYGEPRLTTIAMVSSLTFVTSALTCQHYALLRRAMQFRDLSIIDITANILSAAGAVTIALLGFHYWALVLRPIATNAFVGVGVWLRCRWRPGKPKITSGVTEMLRFGLNTIGFAMTDFAGRSGDRVAIGYRSGPSGLGYYQNALFVYENLLDMLVGPLHGVAAACLSKLDDQKELRRLWAKALSVVAFYAMPAFGVLAVTSQDLIVILLGAKWASAGALLAILALRGIPHSVERTLGWLHVAAGRTDRWMRWGVLSTIAQFTALLCGLPFGPTGVVTAYVICTFILFVPAIAYAGRPVQIAAPDVVRVVWQPLIGALAAAGIGFLLRQTMLAETAAIIRIMVLAGAYLTVYFVMVVLVFRLRMPISVGMSLFRDLVPARFARYVRTPGFINCP